MHGLSEPARAGERRALTASSEDLPVKGSLPLLDRILLVVCRIAPALCIVTDYLRHPLVDDAVVRFSDAPTKTGFDPEP